jgi:putative transposase
MKKSRFSEEQIIAVLKVHRAGIAVADICRKHGISDATFYNWCNRYGGMEVSDARRLKALDDENRKLKKLLAEPMLPSSQPQPPLDRSLRWEVEHRPVGAGGAKLPGITGRHHRLALAASDPQARTAAVPASRSHRERSGKPSSFGAELARGLRSAVPCQGWEIPMSSCISIGLGDVISGWLAGARLVDSTCIYGYSPIWIGRFGKIIGFLAALTIIIDLIGEKRLELITENSELRWRQINNIIENGTIKYNPSILDKFFHYQPYPFTYTLIVAYFFILILIAIFKVFKGGLIIYGLIPVILISSLFFAWYFNKLSLWLRYHVFEISYAIVKKKTLCRIIRFYSVIFILISFSTDLLLS